MIERFINTYLIRTNFKQDKLIWIIGIAYLLYFSVGQLAEYATVTLWVILPAAFLYVLYHHFFVSYSKFSPSIILYTLFFVWAFISGLPVYLDDMLFFTHLRRVFICLVLMTCVHIALDKSGNFRILMLCYFLSSLFICGYSYFTGDLAEILNQEDLAYEYDGTTYVTAQRLHGLVGNSNGMGGYSIIGFIALSLLFFETRSILVKVFYVLSGTLFFYTIAAAGTRGGLFITVAYFSLWMFFTLRSKFRLSPTYFILLIIIGGVSYYAYENVIKSSTIGLRVDSQANIKDDKRYAILTDAFNVFLEYPITGVGLAQFEVYSADGAITHNDYLEVLTNTGIIGGILYYSMFVLILFQLLQMRRKMIMYPDQLYYLNYLFAIYITILIYGIIRHHLWDFGFMMMMAIMSSYCHYLKKQLDSKRREQIALERTTV